MPIVNFSKNIIDFDDETIRGIYITDLQKRFSLHLNAKGHEIEDISIYMLIFKNSYVEFIFSFLDVR